MNRANLDKSEELVTNSTIASKYIPNRGGVWPGKNHKYFKKRKLNLEFQIFLLFNILLQKIHFDIKMLYNFVYDIMHKIFRQKYIYF